MDAQPTSSNAPHLTQIQAAALLNLSPRTLEKYRVIGGGPKFRKYGTRVRYTLADLNEWSAARTCESTSDPLYTARPRVSKARPMKCDSRSTRLVAERNQLEIFRAMPGDMAARDAQDLMAYPFFALGKNRRTIPIHFEARQVVVRVEGTAEHGIATIWDADVLIWAASQIVEARDAQLPTSRLIAATPYEILQFTGRGTSLRDYQRLRSALDRLQSTTVATTIRQPSVRRLHRFSWINEWTEKTTRNGRSLGLELILPDWFYTGVLDSTLVLTIDRAYFRLSGGIERWLYRLVRKHAGHQAAGWRFDIRHLHAKSGSLARFSDFAIDIRRIAIRQPLPGYELMIERNVRGVEILAFRPRTPESFDRALRQLVAACRVGDKR